MGVVASSPLRRDNKLHARSALADRPGNSYPSSQAHGARQSVCLSTSERWLLRMRHVRCRSSTAHSRRLQYPPLRSDFCTSLSARYLQVLIPAGDGHASGPAAGLYNRGHGAGQGLLTLTCLLASARFAQNASMMVTAAATITIWIATASSFQHASIPANATPRSSAGSGRWRRRPHRDLPAV